MGADTAGCRRFRRVSGRMGKRHSLASGQARGKMMEPPGIEPGRWRYRAPTPQPGGPREALRGQPSYIGTDGRQRIARLAFFGVAPSGTTGLSATAFQAAINLCAGREPVCQ